MKEAEMNKQRYNRIFQIMDLEIGKVLNFSVLFFSGNLPENCTFDVRFEVFTAVTMNNGVFWVVTPCGSCKNRRFGGT
jgi:hypothetical protein